MFYLFWYTRYVNANTGNLPIQSRIQEGLCRLKDTLVNVIKRIFIGIAPAIPIKHYKLKIPVLLGGERMCVCTLQGGWCGNFFGVET